MNQSVGPELGLEMVGQAFQRFQPRMQLIVPADGADDVPGGNDQVGDSLTRRRPIRRAYVSVGAW